MISVSLELFGVVRCVVGRRQVPLTLPDGSTIDDAVGVLLDETGEALDGLVRGEGASYRVIFRVNGRPTRETARTLVSGDVIQLLYPVSGG